MLTGLRTGDVDLNPLVMTLSARSLQYSYGFTFCHAKVSYGETL